MPLNRKRNGTLAIAAGVMSVALTLALAMSAPNAGAQTMPDSPEHATLPPPQEVVQTIFLKNVPEQNDLNDIQTDIRNMLPRAKTYGVQSQNAVTIKATHDDMETAQKLIADLDRPKPFYRLTYTITDFDGGKRTGAQSVVILAELGQRSIFKQGNRVPIITGTNDSHAQSSQVQYQDIGLSIEATVFGSPDGLTLRTKFEQSALAGDRSANAAQDPIVHQSVLQETAKLAPGKPTVLGSLDIPGTTQRQEIEVKPELVQ